MRDWLGRLYVIPAILAMMVAAAIGTALVLPLLLLPRGRRERPGMAVAAAWCRFMVQAVLFTRVQAEGLEHIPTGGFLVISNHRAWLDTPLLVMHTHAAGVAKKELLYLPFFGQGALATGTLFFDRRDVASRAAVLTAATEMLRAGQRLHVFPEGTRTRTGKLATKVHLRMVEAAAAAGVPVLPACTWDTEKVLPTTRIAAFPFGSAGVAFAPPQHLQPGERPEDFARRCWDEVVRLARAHGADG